MGGLLDVGCCQPWLHFYHGDEELLEALKGNVIEWACYPGCFLGLGIAGPMKPPIFAIVGCPPESYCCRA